MVWRETFSSAPSPSWLWPLDFLKLISFSLKFMVTSSIPLVLSHGRGKSIPASGQKRQPTVVGNLSTAADKARIRQKRSRPQCPGPETVVKGSRLFRQRGLAALAPQSSAYGGRFDARSAQSVFPTYTPPEKRFHFLPPPMGGGTLRGFFDTLKGPGRSGR